VAGNTITGTGFSPNGPDIGGIVVAADLPGSSVTDVTVSDNVVTDSAEAGVIVNAEARGSFTKDVHVTGNTVTGNNWLSLNPRDNTAGIVVFANPKPMGDPDMADPANIDTMIWNNVVTDQFYGIWSLGDFAPTVSGNDITVTDGGTPIFIG
jgi:hypothetical protein